MIIGVIQARMTSTRLPGKVLKPFLDKPMLCWQVERIQQSKKLDKIVIATSHEASDDAIAELCQEKSWLYFRGSLDDVLSRFYLCASHYQATHIVRLTADCPLSDPVLIDQVISLHLDQGNDYTSNCYPHTFPDGVDVEVMTFHALEQTNHHASTIDEREHVTLYLRQPEHGFTIGALHAPEDYSGLRWTVDYPEDFEVASFIFEQLADQGCFGYQDVIKLEQKYPEVFSRNKHYVVKAES